MKHLQKSLSKITDLQGIQKKLEQWRKENRRIVFTNGCFDLVHRGHVEYLSEAADLGDVLVVGLNSDASVSRLKGPHRPIIDETSRSILLSALECIDAVVLFEEDTPLELIRKIQPDVLVKGGDYSEATIVGADIVRAGGGSVRCIPLTPDCSTSRIETKIKNQR